MITGPNGGRLAAAVIDAVRELRDVLPLRSPASLRLVREHLAERHRPLALAAWRVADDWPLPVDLDQREDVAHARLYLSQFARAVMLAEDSTRAGSNGAQSAAAWVEFDAVARWLSLIGRSFGEAVGRLPGDLPEPGPTDPDDAEGGAA